VISLTWQAVLRVRHLQAEALLSSLITEGGYSSPQEEGGSFEVSLQEISAKNLRAFWNTKLRSLEAAEGALNALVSLSAVESL
jgi:hypothetical protein